MKAVGARRRVVTASGSDEGRGDRGAISVFVAVLAVAFLAAAGLALDGGRRLGAISEARDIADNAARACAQGISIDESRRSGATIIDPALGAQLGGAHLARSGSSGSVSVAGDGQSCTATVTVTVSTTFLPGPYSVTQSQTADAIEGF